MNYYKQQEIVFFFSEVFLVYLVCDKTSYFKIFSQKFNLRKFPLEYLHFQALYFHLYLRNNSVLTSFIYNNDVFRETLIILLKK